MNTRPSFYFLSNFIGILLVGGFFSLRALAAEIAVIANPMVKSEVSQESVMQLFLGIAKKLPDGQSATPVDQPERSDIRNSFYLVLIGKNPTQMKNYWSQQIFTGKSFPPPTAADDTAVKNWVNSKEGGIGYINATSVDKTTRVLFKLNSQT